jgi:hypothetical protein
MRFRQSIVIGVRWCSWGERMHEWKRKAWIASDIWWVERRNEWERVKLRPGGQSAISRNLKWSSIVEISQIFQ